MPVEVKQTKQRDTLLFSCSCTLQVNAIPVCPVSDTLVAIIVMDTEMASPVTTTAFELIFQQAS